MFCVQCGTKFEGRFCPNCGTAVNNNTSVEEVVTPKPTVGMVENCSGEFTSVRTIRKYYEKMERVMAEVNEINYHIAELGMEREYEIADCFIGMEQEVEREAKKDGLLKKATKAYFTMGISVVMDNKKKKQVQEGVEARGREKIDFINEKYDKQIEAEKQKIEMRLDCLNSLASEKEFYDAKLSMPEEYLDYDIIDFMYVSIQNGRADTWKELLSIYHDELYKRQMIDLNKKQLEALNEIKELEEDIFAVTGEILETTIDVRDEIKKSALENNSLMREQLDTMHRMKKTLISTKRGVWFNAFFAVINPMRKQKIRID